MIQLSHQTLEFPGDTIQLDRGLGWDFTVAAHVFRLQLLNRDVYERKRRMERLSYRNIGRRTFDVLPIQHTNQLRPDTTDVVFDHAPLDRSEIRNVLREREPGRRNTQCALHISEQFIDVATGHAQTALMIRVERIYRSFGHRGTSPVISKLRLTKSHPAALCQQRAMHRESSSDSPIHAKVDVEWADLDVFFRTIFWVLRRLHQRHNCSWVPLAKLHDLVEKLIHVRRREIRAPDHLASELLCRRLLKVSDFG